MNTFSAAPDSPGLKLRWGDGWVDDFPEDEFIEECEDRSRRISIYHRRHEECASEYSLTVRGHEARLDYGGRFREANTSPERDFDIGILLIRFADEVRDVVAELLWKGEGKKSFSNQCKIEASWAESRSIAPFRPSKADHRKRRLLNSVLRPGQLRFRRQLLSAYGALCCMTGCTIESTLEAAHIMPYLGTDYDHRENGLLMRADIHRLFDNLLIGVEPQTLRIVLAPLLKSESQYSVLAGHRLQLSSGSIKPSPKALEDHWRRFKEESTKFREV